MLLRDAFEKDIYRAIDPVVKANETDDAHLANELEEFVVTNEVRQHLLDFLDEYNEPASVSNGAWISGFFGSGKSHLLKILAAALENREVTDADGTTRHTMDYLVPKVADMPALASAMELAPRRHPSESVIFNIDSYAPNSGRAETGALLSAFIKAFNHHCGYFDGDQQHIAKMEYDLDQEGRLDAFRSAVEARVPNKDWEKIRKSAPLYRRQISAAFDEVSGNPEGYTTDVVRDYKEDYHPDIRMFAQRVAEYIRSKGQRGYRVNFFVDEVGQFIAQNANLMVNLQTIAEELDRYCGGDSWVIVTSQENMDDIVGQMKSISANDFSKIQARFHVKMPLTSSDAKEVIRDRLLAKKDEDRVDFEALYERYRGDFGVLFDFADGAKTYKSYQDCDEFCSTYPFVPYQFELFMSAMRGLSDHNCFTGRHNSTGARSMLGVFQMVAERICDEGASTQDGTLAPFDYMFEGLRNDLRGEVYADITTAEDQLDDKCAVRLLKALLLVKYIDDFRATPANLRVLLYGSFKENTSELNQRIQGALDELERQVYVRRNGNVYEYLTNDEKEVEQEISNLVLPEKEIRDVIADLFREVCGVTKVSYRSGSFEHAYPYNLRIDGEAVGLQRNDLTLNLVTDYEADGLFADQVPTPPKTLTVALRGARDFLHDVGTYKKTDHYTHVNIGATEVRQAIIVDKQTANLKLQRTLVGQLRDLLTHATYNAGGVDVTGQVTGAGRDAVNSALLELVRRSYTGLQQITCNYTDNDIYSQVTNAQMGLGGALEDYCQSVLARVKMTPGTVTVAGDGVGSLTSWFSKNEYGWPEVAVRSAVARLYVANRIEVRKAGMVLDGTQLAEALARKRDLDKLTIKVVEEVSPERMGQIQRAFRAFAGTNPKETDPKSISAELAHVADDLAVDAARSEVDARHYPFAAQFDAALKRVRECAEKARDRSWVVGSFPERAPELAQASEDLKKMTAFCSGSPMAVRWKELRDFLGQKLPALVGLDLDQEGIDEIRSVVEDPDCYRSGRIPGAYKAMQRVQADADERIAGLRGRALSDLAAYRSTYEQSYDLAALPEERRASFERVFDTARGQLESMSSPLAIRSFVDTFKDRNAGALIALLRKPAPEPAATGTSAEKPAEGGGATAPAAEPPKPRQPRTVSVRRLDTSGFGRPVIGSAEDADEYLATLRASIIEALDRGETVTV